LMLVVCCHPTLRSFRKVDGSEWAERTKGY
jgi:hypothetical protein